MLKIAGSKPLALPGPKARSRGELFIEGALTLALCGLLVAYVAKPGENPFAPFLLAWGLAHTTVRGAIWISAVPSHLARYWRWPGRRASVRDRSRSA